MKPNRSDYGTKNLRYIIVNGNKRILKDHCDNCYLRNINCYGVMNCGGKEIKEFIEYHTGHKHVCEDPGCEGGAGEDTMELKEVLTKLWLGEIGVKEAERIINKIIDDRIIEEFEIKRNEVKK